MLIFLSLKHNLENSKGEEMPILLTHVFTISVVLLFLEVPEFLIISVLRIPCYSFSVGLLKTNSLSFLSS